MQSKLATWSTEDKERKFDRLLRLIAERVWLSEAARITLASSGARTPGVDGVSKRMMEENLQHELATIRDELLAGSYSPLPARRVYIAESERQAQATRHPESAGSNCSTGHADGDGADLGE